MFLNNDVTLYLQITMVVFSFSFLAIVIAAVKKNKLDVQFSIGWFTLAFVYIFIAALPHTMQFIADILNVKEAANAIFIVNIAFLIIAVFTLFCSVTKSNKRVRLLVQEVSLLKQHLAEKEKEYDKYMGKDTK